MEIIRVTVLLFVICSTGQSVRSWEYPGYHTEEHHHQHHHHVFHHQNIPTWGSGDGWSRHGYVYERPKTEFLYPFEREEKEKEMEREQVQLEVPKEPRAEEKRMEQEERMKKFEEQERMQLLEQREREQEERQRDQEEQQKENEEKRMQVEELQKELEKKEKDFERREEIIRRELDELQRRKMEQEEKRQEFIDALIAQYKNRTVEELNRFSMTLMENQMKEDELRKKSLPELEQERQFRVTEEREEIVQRGDGPAIVMRSRNSSVTTDSGRGTPGTGGNNFYRNSSSSSSSRTGSDGTTTGSRSSSQFQSGSETSGSVNINRFAQFKDEDDLINSNRVTASSLVPVAAMHPSLENILGLMNVKVQYVLRANRDGKLVRKIAASTLNEILAKTGASLLGTRTYAPKPFSRVKMSFT